MATASSLRNRIQRLPDRNNRLSGLRPQTNGANRDGEDVAPAPLRRLALASAQTFPWKMTAPVHFHRIHCAKMLTMVDADTKNPAVLRLLLWLFHVRRHHRRSCLTQHSGNPERLRFCFGKNGISVKGKIVLVRYSNPLQLSRPSRALTAEREGAAALLIYSDPAERRN